MVIFNSVGVTRKNQQILSTDSFGRIALKSRYLLYTRKRKFFLRAIYSKLYTEQESNRFVVTSAQKSSDVLLTFTGFLKARF